MRLIGSLALMGAVLACSQPADTKVEPAAAAATQASPPALNQTAYRMDAQLFNEETGQTMPIVMVRDGAKTRMEISRPGEGRMVYLTNETEAYIVIDTMGTLMAVRGTRNDLQTPEAEWTDVSEGVRRLGPCTAAGETGAEYESTDTGEGSQGVACITSDGIMLKATENGRVIWEAIRVQRGPQDPTLFQLPANAQVVDPAAMGGGN